MSWRGETVRVMGRYTNGDPVEHSSLVGLNQLRRCDSFENSSTAPTQLQLVGINFCTTVQGFSVRETAHHTH